MPERERVLNVRMTEQEMEMVRVVAEATGLGQSDTIRQLVRRAYEQLGRAKRKRK